MTVKQTLTGKSEQFCLFSLPRIFANKRREERYSPPRKKKMAMD